MGTIRDGNMESPRWLSEILAAKIKKLVTEIGLNHPPFVVGVKLKQYGKTKSWDRYVRLYDPVTGRYEDVTYETCPLSGKSIREIMQTKLTRAHSKIEQYVKRWILFLENDLAKESHESKGAGQNEDIKNKNISPRKNLFPSLLLASEIKRLSNKNIGTTAREMASIINERNKNNGYTTTVDSIKKNPAWRDHTSKRSKKKQVHKKK